MTLLLLGQLPARGIMDPNSFQLLSEDYTDEEFLELFGSESLTLDSEYQAVASLQRITTVKPPIEQRKAQVRYERESAAKLTQYSLETTFTMPDTVRATPTLSLPPLSEERRNEPSSSAVVVPQYMSRNKMKLEQYRQTRLDIRRQRLPQPRNTINPPI